MLTMTLSQIRDAGPCGVDRDSETGYRRLLLSLGQDIGRWDPATVVSLGDIARSNGAGDAWWCVRCLDWSDIAVRRAVIAVLLRAVRRAAAHTTDERVHDTVASLQCWCDGDDSVALYAARADAYAAYVASETDAASATDAAYAAHAAFAAAYAADADYTASAAAAAAAEAAEATAYAADAEDAAQAADLIAAFPPLYPVAG